MHACDHDKAKRIVNENVIVTPAVGGKREDSSDGRNRCAEANKWSPKSHRNPIGKGGSGEHGKRQSNDGAFSGRQARILGHLVSASRVNHDDISAKFKIMPRGKKLMFFCQTLTLSLN